MGAPRCRVDSRDQCEAGCGWSRSLRCLMNDHLTNSQMTFGCTGSLAASSSRPDNANVPRYTTSTSPPSLPSREEEEEPYIIYSSSPSSSMSSLSDDLQASSTPTPHPSISIHPLSSTLPPSKRTHHRRRSSASLVDLRRRPSLSSIYEVPEED